MLNRKPKLVVIGFDFTLSKPEPFKYWYTLYIKGYILKHQHPKQIRIWHRGRSPSTWHQCDDVDTGCGLNLWLTISWMYHFCNRILSFFCNCIEYLWLWLVERWKYILKNCSNEFCLYCTISRPTYIYWNNDDTCVQTW